MSRSILAICCARELGIGIRDFPQGCEITQAPDCGNPVSDDGRELDDDVRLGEVIEVELGAVHGSKSGS